MHASGRVLEPQARFIMSYLSLTLAIGRHRSVREVESVRAWMLFRFATSRHTNLYHPHGGVPKCLWYCLQKGVGLAERGLLWLRGT